MIMKTILLMLFVILSASVLAQSEPAPVTIEHVNGQVYQLSGSGGNLGASIGHDGIVLIDDQYAPMTPGILAALREVSDVPLRFVINTHWHGDHTGGNANMAGEGAWIVAHDNVRQRMSTDQIMGFTNTEVKASPAQALPVVTFDSEVSLHLNGEEVRIYHVPFAHTDGDSIVHFTTSNVLHMGDTFWGALYPRIDLDTGATVHGAADAVRKGIGLCTGETKVITGHGGPVSDCAGMEAYLAMLETSMERVGQLVDEGKSLQEIQALKPMADHDESWGSWYIKADAWLGIVYGSLTSDSD